MRTILIAHPSADLYGSDRVMLETITALTERDWRVVVTVPAPGPLVAEIVARRGEVVICPSPVLRKSALKPLGMLKLIGEVLHSLPTGIRVLRSTRAEVLYVSTITVPLWFVIGRLLRRPVVGHVHEAERSASPLIRKALAAPLLLAHQLVVNSRFSLDVLADAFPTLGRRSVVVYNGVPGPAAIVPARRTPDAPFRAVFVGRLSPRKGPQVAVDAVARLAGQGVDVHLDLVGAVFPGYEWFEEQLRADVAARGLADRVTFQGFRSDVWGAVADADVVLVPSQGDEPFGNTAVEAVLAARPVIASASSGLLEAVAGYGCAQSVTPSDVPGWAAAIDTVRTGWDAYRAAAAADAAVAADRHAPERYRTTLADALLAHTRSGAGVPAAATARAAR